MLYRKHIISLTGLLLLLAITNICFAQGAPPPPPPDVPIDGGILALLAAGLGYGVRKLHNKQ